MTLIGLFVAGTNGSPVETWKVSLLVDKNKESRENRLIQISALTSCLTTGKILNFSVLQSLQLYSEDDNSTNLLELLCECIYKAIRAVPDQLFIK